MCYNSIFSSYFHLFSLCVTSPPPQTFASPPSDAQPTEAETAVWNQVSAVLEEAHGILAELQSYNGAGQDIREVSTVKGVLLIERFRVRK